MEIENEFKKLESVEMRNSSQDIIFLLRHYVIITFMVIIVIVFVVIIIFNYRKFLIKHPWLS